MADEGILVKASIRLLPIAEGGRTTPISGSYRPNHNFFEPDNRNMATGFIEIPSGMKVGPGESIELAIQFWKWPDLDGQIYPGREWRIQEGSKLVAIATVLEVISSL
jgi:translation elongation factor EF-Tu-like GTPase